jgi:hypothetical protein
MTLVRTETANGHRYRLDGKHVSGVTTLLNKGYPKPMLIPWAARTVAEYVADNFATVSEVYDKGREDVVDLIKNAHNRKRDRAAARGTDVHAYAEKLIHGEDVEVPQHLDGYVDGYVSFIDDWKIVPVLTERICASRQHWYSGTFDAVVQFGAGHLEGQRYMLDWKTSRGVYGDSSMQLAAYANSEFYLDDDGQEQPTPKVDGLGVVHITPSGTDLYLVSDPAAAWQQFLHVMWVAKNVNAIDRQIMEPTYLGASA